MLLYKAYDQLEGTSESGLSVRIAKVTEIEQLIRDKRWDDARQRAAELINMGLEGLRYLQTWVKLSLRSKNPSSDSFTRYDRFLIRGIVIVAYLGWAAYAALFIFRPPSSDIPRSITTMISVSVMLMFWAMFAVQKSPMTFYVYVAFPCYFWNEVVLHAMEPVGSWFRERTLGFYGRSLIQAGLVIGVLQSMVVCTHRLQCITPSQYTLQAAYTHRWLWSLGFVLMGIAWPLLSWPSHVRSQIPRLFFSWAVICIVTASFPLLGVEKKESLSTM